VCRPPISPSLWNMHLDNQNSFFLLPLLMEESVTQLPLYTPPPSPRSSSRSLKNQPQHRHNPQLQVAKEFFSQGWEFYKQHDYASAMKWLQQSVTIREQVVGTYHRSTGKSYWALAWALYNWGEDPEQAHWTFRRSWRIFCQLYGHTHILSKTAFRGMRLSLLEAGFVDQAATHYRAILNDSLKHEQRGDAGWRRGDYVSALTEYRKALVPLEDEPLGKQGPDAAELYCKVASCVLNRNKTKLHQHHGLENEPNPGRPLENKSPMHKMEQSLVYLNYDEYMALELYGRAFSIYQSALGPTHPDTINTLEMIKELRPNSSHPCGRWWWAPLHTFLAFFRFCFPPAEVSRATS
jgi:tetratricopeptide (TPR) repeat protein